MKTAHDPRHLERIRVIEELFAWQFNHKSKIKSSITKNITTNLQLIDAAIEKSAPERPLAQINKIDLAILRLAIYELTVEKNAPYKVIVDEAIELAKQYGADSSPAFTNGVLGKVILEFAIDKG
ncbi:transcription antitermination factor NusB [Candidatus Daviesbacteria bacterium RIFCSPLOWO2_02_FULL_40_8]|uniref:Transcription antitermination factor NusB n=1 Tax=Candidatus Daviesbacteria bacterium RIFCSPLOWO2_01_FULL_40_24 TaxID=1797787 RepID=A0A1F5MJ35_9BACT|nr:MAG: transcription antitermination factor NusB [Candidatus Daviesbacteria bacterium RIFCSPHIGHO2_01_FULL_41_45]OGE35551.1 MAG: transcription antitermination factor NusB [Candidatus Daviesbacteria bacterium RIFCSPHIGHO2_02_FULL_41_14]OGE65300.1 MAG: transcription antitermination factor NusB [Candidatus Daviesbacteria bacterium RIFCSPLOWO2_01_FULL_40_24]OGE66948.1 MAG: transcription antitermination factor NusB [Candidatus Daviesbacteria bacterium RIFCSPLOWO2_02_FULL_40_8]